mgnify:CR=1 FL=1|jgi:hypothetical protein
MTHSLKKRRNNTQTRVNHKDLKLFNKFYKTCSKVFMKELNKYAKKLGIQIRPTGMYIYGNNKRVNAKFNSCEDIFNILFLKYVPNNKRDSIENIQTILPVINDLNADKPTSKCYSDCDMVPLGHCATGCNPSWVSTKLNKSRNWCKCNLNGTRCDKHICSNQTRKNKKTKSH